MCHDSHQKHSTSITLITNNLTNAICMLNNNGNLTANSTGRQVHTCKLQCEYIQNSTYRTQKYKQTLQ